MIKQIYEQVHDYIEADVQQRAPGEYLPSEVQYSIQLSVSRLTVRKAVDELVKRGMVARIAGKGLMVNNNPDHIVRGRLLISCIAMAGDGDLFKSVLGCIDAASRHQYEYKLFNYPSAAEQYRAILAEDLSRYDGAVITCFESEAEQCTLNLIRNAHLPVIIIGNEKPGIPYVMSDDYNGGYLIADDMAKHGHKDILYITTDRDVQDVPRRLAGFRQGLLDNGIEHDPELILSISDPGVPLFLGSGALRELPFSAEKFLERRINYTAVTGYSSLPVFSFCYQLHRRGIEVPKDISLAGYGDQLYLPWLNLPISGIMEPKYEMGYEAVRQMHRYLSGEKAEMENSIKPVRYLHHKSVLQI